MTGLTSADVPRLPRGVRLRFDPVRNAHVLLAPERNLEHRTERQLQEVSAWAEM